MALTKITKTGIGADAIDATKLGDDVISDEHLDITSITGQTELSEAAAASDYILIYDSSAGILKKIAASNVGTQAVTLSSVSPTNALTGDGTGNHTFTITGTNLTGATAVLVTDGGSEVDFDTVTVDSATQITAVIAKSSLSNANEPYDVRIYGSNGTQAILRNQINVDASPIFNTASGSVGSFQEQTTISTIDIQAYDPESASNVTFEIISGALPAGLSATTVNEDGVSKYRITGTLTTNISSNTTTNFTLRASDANSNISSRAFSITETPYNVQSFTSSGTFSVPSGVTSVNVLVVAGGGGGGGQVGGAGGAGGLIYRPGYPVTPGGTVSVTVGCGGAGGEPINAAVAGQDSIFGTLTAKGGGRGGSYNVPGRCGGAGGSGGGGAMNGSVPYPTSGGSATQPIQGGDSGTYGFGNAGGAGGNPCGAEGGGGGGAGAAGSPVINPGSPTGQAGPGGIGRAYTIADGITSVYYAGGGGGGAQTICRGSTGGQGGGGNGGYNPSPSAQGVGGQAGQANKGGGGGGSRDVGPAGHPWPGNLADSDGGAGGKGIVIVQY